MGSIGRFIRKTDAGRAARNAKRSEQMKQFRTRKEDERVEIPLWMQQRVQRERELRVQSNTRVNRRR